LRVNVKDGLLGKGSAADTGGGSCASDTSDIGALAAADADMASF